jgi:hypothetical protein
MDNLVVSQFECGRRYLAAGDGRGFLPWSCTTFA